MAKTNTTTVNTGRKTTCPITRQAFTLHGTASTPVVSIAGQGVAVAPREFKQAAGASGASMGYYGNGKVQLMIDGVPTMCQVGLTITVIGSKDLPATTQGTPPSQSASVLAIMAASKATAAGVAAAVA